jgi:hypothetical protein
MALVVVRGEEQQESNNKDQLDFPSPVSEGKLLF